MFKFILGLILGFGLGIIIEGTETAPETKKDIAQKQKM